MTSLWSRRSLRLGDQLLSSGSNFIISIGLARPSDLHSFGVYSLVLLAYLLVLYLTRAFVGEAALIAAKPVSSRPETSAACSTALLVGLICGAGMAPWAALATGEPRVVILLLAASLPLVAVQDAMRYLLLGRQAEWAACLSDGAWVLVAGSGVIMLGSSSPTISVLAWIAGLFLATIIGYLLVGRPRVLLRGAERWVRSAPLRRLAGLGMDNGATFAMSVAFTVVTAVALDLEALGSIRKALVALAPVTVLNNALGVMVLAERSALLPRLRSSAFVAVLSAVPALLWMAILVGPGRRFGEDIVGPGWDIVVQLIPGLSLYVVLQAATLVAINMIKRTGRTTRAAQLRALALVLQTGCVWLGTMGGAEGVVWGLVAAWAGLVAACWLALLMEINRAGPAAGVDTQLSDQSSR